jgi:hypothetical protein
MERKGSNTVEVTTAEVRTALSRTRTLSSSEEKALRMRHGIGVDSPLAPLPRAAGDNVELADELLLMEMQLLKAMRAHAKSQDKVTLGVAPQPSKSKDKIVRALRRKK